MVIGVLVLSAAEAYRIQVGVSQQQLEIYRRYVDEEATLAVLRRNLWLAGNDIRDFFISNTPEQGAALSAQLKSLEEEDRQALEHLRRSTFQRQTEQKLRQSLDEFWTEVEPVPAMLHASNREQFAFLQNVVVPRRGELYNALVALSGADQQKLQESETGFADTRHRAARGLFLMIALSVLLSIVVARLSVRHAENLERAAERHYAEVEQTKGELQQLSARLLEVEEEGRRRLSRELHDEIGQTLALLQIEISHVQAAAGYAPLLQERLRRARELAERTVQTIRNISVLLRPPLLDDLGLVPALQYQLEDFLRRSAIPCEFVEEGVDDHLPDSVKTCVYRVVQEALHNCEKHAGAGKVRVVVRQLPDCLVLEVEDNGRGFQMNEQRMPSRRAGLGLLGIRERTANAGGSLVIDSAPGQGTRVALRIPLPSASTPKGATKEVSA